MPNKKKKLPVNRILIIRTDRIGDVLLSTPVIAAVRMAFPKCYIAFMAAPHARAIVEGNPKLNEVVIFDKKGEHSTLKGMWGLAKKLRAKQFDVALVLHSTTRVNLVTFLAKIPKRIGWSRKAPFLLTAALDNQKKFGRKHEVEYNLDLLRALGVEARFGRITMPLDAKDADLMRELLHHNGVEAHNVVAALHPGASCPSKRWPVERFAALADRLIDERGVKVVVVAGPDQVDIAQVMVSAMKNTPVNYAGKTDLKQLAALLARAKVFISNDSGPVHMAVAVGTPVVALFGRNQPGLGPRRWGPLGDQDIVIRKDVGCTECRAHNCTKDFACLHAITVEEVYQAACRMLQAAGHKL